MKKFVHKILLFLFLLMISIICFILFSYYVIGSQYSQDYNAAMIDKVRRLQSINEPKIILVGDSNVAFGFNSELIEKEMQMKVVNLGLSKGLGDAFSEQAAQLNINEGDIVALCHYKFDFNDDRISPDVAWVTYDYNDEILPIFHFKDYKGMLKAYPTHLRKIFFLWLTGQGNKRGGPPYTRDSFNEYGDVVLKPPKPQHTYESLFSSASISPTNIDIDNCERINKLNQFCIERGAKLVVAGYPIGYGDYSDFTAEDFALVKEHLESILDCDIISDYSDYFYPYSFFYDTFLHLNEEGTNVRTAQFISDLKKWMKQ